MQKTEEEPTLTAILGGNKPPYAQLQTGKKLSYFTISIRLNLSGTQRCPHSNRWEYLGWLGESKVRGFQREIEREREEEEEEERVVVFLCSFSLFSLGVAEHFSVPHHLLLISTCAVSRP